VGDYLQTLVAPQVAETEARSKAEDLRSWLVSEGIVARELTDCVLGGSGVGHPPGERFSVAAGVSDPLLERLATNGVDIEVGRIVALDPQGENRWQCGSCGEWQSDADPLMDNISAWYDGDDAAAVTCPVCANESPLAGVVTDPPMAFGGLAVTFWNWPPLVETFLQQVSDFVGGPIKLVTGKL